MAAVAPFRRAAAFVRSDRLPPLWSILDTGCAKWLSDSLRPFRRSVPEPRVYGLGYIGSERPSCMVGTGSAVSPFSLRLSGKGLGSTDPTIAPPLTVQSFAVSRRAWISDLARFGRSVPGVLSTA
jgi:hypothetical protein